MTALSTSGASALVLTTEAADLAAASISPNTAHAYRTAFGQFAQLLAGRTASDALISDYIGELHSKGKAPATLGMAVAAIRFAARKSDQDDPTGPLTDQVLTGARRTGRERARGQDRLVSYDEVIAMQAVAMQPRKRGRGIETPLQSHKRGTVDRALAGAAFQAGLRRSEIAALAWRDLEDAPNLHGAILVAVRTSKTNQDGSEAEIRLV